MTEAIDASSLAKITDGYTPGHMVQAIQQILTERRIQQVCEIVCDFALCPVLSRNAPTLFPANGREGVA